MSSGSTIGIGWFPATGTVKCARLCNRARRAEGRMFSSLASARAEVSSIPPMMQLRPERRPTATATASSESNSRGGTAEP